MNDDKNLIMCKIKYSKISEDYLNSFRLFGR